MENEGARDVVVDEEAWVVEGRDVAGGGRTSGGFCAGLSIVVDHQRINAPSVVFSASMPVLLATSASEAIAHLRKTPSVLATLQENIRAVRTVLEKTDGITVLGHRASPIVHFCLRTTSNSLAVPPSASAFDGEAEERILQDIADDALATGVLLTRAKHLKAQEMIESRPTIRIAVSAAFTKEMDQFSVDSLVD